MIQEAFRWLPKVLNRSMIKVLNKITSKDEEHKDRHADFANLPTLVLWMIKDRLDYPSNRCFASVCKSWHDATLSYSKDVRLCKESPPWLMIKDLKCHGRCKFINTSTGKRYSLFHRDLYHAETLFTKQGWLLLVTSKMRTNNEYKISCGLWPENDTELGRRLSLLNPFAKKKIELPDEFSWLLEDCKGAFTLVDGKPDLVAFAGLDKEGRCLRLWTIHVTDHNSLWTEHTFNNTPGSWYYFRPRCVVIIGHNIYMVCKTSQLLVFNLSSSEWVSGGQSSSPAGNVYLDTKKGVLWKWKADPRRPAVWFGLNEDCCKWEKLKFEELVSKFWLVRARSCPNYDNGYVVSKDVDDAIFKDLVKSSNYLRKVNVLCRDDDDPNIFISSIKYMIDWDKNIAMARRNVEWVDMPSN